MASPIHGYTGRARDKREFTIVIDGVPVADVRDVSIERDTMEPFISDWTLYRHASGTTRLELRTLHNTVLGFDIADEWMASESESRVTTYYIYGPLRQLFPSLFADKDLLEWQIAYLKHINAPKYLKYKLFRNDAEFITTDAQYFSAGYSAGEDIGQAKGKEIGMRIGRVEATEELTAQIKQQKRKKDRKQWNNKF
jgi:hypothetical protein